MNIKIEIANQEMTIPDIVCIEKDGHQIIYFDFAKPLVLRHPFIPIGGGNIGPQVFHHIFIDMDTQQVGLERIDENLNVIVRGILKKVNLKVGEGRKTDIFGSLEIFESNGREIK